MLGRLVCTDLRLRCRGQKSGSTDGLMHTGHSLIDHAYENGARAVLAGLSSP
jgi:hypothetical protein